MLGCQDYYEDDEVVPPECLAVSAEMDVSCNASLASKYIDLDEYNFAETRILWTTMDAEAAVMRRRPTRASINPRAAGELMTLAGSRGGRHLSP